MKKLLVLFAAFALVLAACGGDDETNSELPINDGSNVGGPAAGACLEGEPDCNDTPGGVPQDLPGPGAGDGSGMVVDGGLTIGDALAANPTGTIALQGFVVAVGEELRLCEALAESFPPQCGGASLLLDSLDTIDPDELKTEGNVTWTDFSQTVLGELNGDLLVTTGLSQ